MPRLVALVLSVLCLARAPVAAVDPSFNDWLTALRQEAAAQGMRPAFLDSTLTGLAVREEVLRLERQQPEVAWTLERYLRGVVTTGRVALGRRVRDQHRQLLDRVSRQYRVQPRFIVALWGIETDYGRNPGQTPVVPALATLAFAGRRADFFRQELLAALRLLHDGQATPGELVGSWAGAMGQPQFMPSTFAQHGVDFDQDGRRDIWRSTPDVLASTANLLSSLGWRDDLTWGREVRLPAEAPAAWDSTARELREWSRLGVRCLDGSPLPDREVEAALVRPVRANGRAFLAYANFQAIKRWNNSTYFAVAVGQLADRIGD
ncbi:MAG: lytic murein transglycosylase [Candidatus Latescibacterota bacterium]